MVACRNWILQDTGLIEVKRRKCVDYRIPAAKRTIDNITYLTVLLEMFSARLVGYMEVSILIDAFALEEHRKPGQEVLEKVCVFSSESNRIPTEYLLFLAIHLGYDLGCVFSAPLREKVRYFKVHYSALVRKVYPASEFFKAEGIVILRVVSVFRCGNIDKLYSWCALRRLRYQEAV